MRKVIKRSTALLFVLVLFVMVYMNSSVIQAETHVMDLQALIDQTDPGETLILEQGYYEGPVVINKPLVIQAEQAVLQNTSLKSAITIDAEQVSVIGLHIEDETQKEEPTVLVNGDQAILKDLEIYTGADGIVVRDANDGIIQGVTIRWVPQGIAVAAKGNAIDLYNAHRYEILDNVISDVHDGIYLENSDDTVVTGNVIEQSRYGVHCMYTKRTVIRENQGNRNVTGAMVMATQQVIVADNVFTKQSENVNSQGILLYDAHQTEVTNNLVEGNRVGMYMEQSTENHVSQNQINYNFIGMQLLEASENTITNNQFVGNVANAQARGSEDNTITENYWDTFKGIDTDGDGISDLTYSVNPFFQALTKKRPQFQLFFQSPGMSLLEGLYQTDRKNWVSDTAPLVSPPNQNMTDEHPAYDASGWAGIVLLGSTSLLFYMVGRRIE